MALGIKTFKAKGWECKVWCGVGKYVWEPFVNFNFYFIPTIQLKYFRNTNLFVHCVLVFQWLCFHADVSCDLRNEELRRRRNDEAQSSV